MKISECIDQLNAIKDVHGDLDLIVFDPEKMVKGEYVECPAFILTSPTEEGVRPTSVAICEQDTFAVFYDETEE